MIAPLSTGFRMHAFARALSLFLSPWHTDGVESRLLLVVICILMPSKDFGVLRLTGGSTECHFTVWPKTKFTNHAAHWRAVHSKRLATAGRQASGRNYRVDSGTIIVSRTGDGPHTAQLKLLALKLKKAANFFAHFRCKIQTF